MPSQTYASFTGNGQQPVTFAFETAPKGNDYVVSVEITGGPSLPRQSYKLNKTDKTSVAMDPIVGLVGVTGTLNLSYDSDGIVISLDGVFAWVAGGPFSTTMNVNNAIIASLANVAESSVLVAEAAESSGASA